MTQTIDLNGEVTMKRVAGRLLPFLMLLYLIAYLDRANISVAALQMNADLGLSKRMYGIGAGVFYITYVLFEVPSNIILSKVGARRWIARIMISWGIVAIAMAFIRNANQLYFMRLLLGAAEAGFTPGIIYFLSQWFPNRNRARAMSFFYIAAALASVIGLPLSGALLEMHGIGGFSGWRWLFFIEGIPALVLGFVVLRYLPQDIESAHWLEKKQRDWLIDKMKQETLEMEGKSGKAHWFTIFYDYKTWMLGLFWLLQAFGTIGITLFVPQVLKDISGASDLKVSILSALPFLLACIFMYFNGKNSDKTGERRLHLGLPLLFSGILLIVGMYSNGAISFSFLAISVGLNWAATPVFWAVTTRYLKTGTSAASGIAFINALANIAGALLPYLIGYTKDTTGDYGIAFWVIGIALASGGLLGVVIGKYANQEYGQSGSVG